MNILCPALAGAYLPNQVDTTMPNEFSISHESADAPVLLNREVVLNRSMKTVGYEFSLLDSMLGDVVRPGNGKGADSALIEHLQKAGIERMLGLCSAYLPMYSLDSLGLAMLQQQLATGLVVELNISTCRAMPAAFIEQAESLKDRGIRFALQFDGHIEPGDVDLYLQADWIVLDLSQPAEISLSPKIDQILQVCPTLQPFVKNVVLQEEFTELLNSSPFSRPIQLFHGPFVVSKTAALEDRPLQGDRMRIMELLNKLKQESDNGKLADALRRDPVVLFKLLRYANSPVTGLRTKVETAEQALMVIGRDKLYNWLTVLLYVSGESDGLEYALLNDSLVRGRLLELLGADKLGKQHANALFLTGMFSLLDVLFHKPLPKILSLLTLPDEIKQALIESSGPYYTFLQIAYACESGTPQELEEVAEANGILANDINIRHVEALVWAQQVEQEG